MGITAAGRADGPSSAMAVTAADVRLTYDRKPALRIDRLEIPAGGVVALVGPNGSGKSTLLSAIGGVLRPSSGRLRVFGNRPQTARRDVAYVLQSTAAAVLPVTVRDVVAMGRYAHRGLWRRLTSEDRDVITSMLERLEIAQLARAQLGDLSAGQRQRVLVAQGLAQQAPMLLLDEPLTGLDVVSQQRIVDVIELERRAGRTVLLATHDLREAQRADFVVLLAGRIVCAGPPAHALRTRFLQDAYAGRLLNLGGAGSLLDDHAHGTADERHASARGDP